jgi:hypothetical protein
MTGYVLHSLVSTKPDSRNMFPFVDTVCSFHHNIHSCRCYRPTRPFSKCPTTASLLHPRCNSPVSHKVAGIWPKSEVVGHGSFACRSCMLSTVADVYVADVDYHVRHISWHDVIRGLFHSHQLLNHLVAVL